VSCGVVCVSDAAFVAPTAVAIASALRQVAEPAATRVFVVDAGLGQQDRALLARHVAAAGAELEILAVPTAAPVPDVAVGHVSRATFLRLLAPDLVPEDVAHLLYLDGDVLAVDSLDPLWSSELGGRAIGAVRDFEVPLVSSPGGIGDWRHRGIDPAAPYVNAGVLLIDAARWRELGIGERALDDQRRRGTVSGDQGSLNAVAQGEIVLLDPRWNAQGSVMHVDLFAPSPHKEALLSRRDELLHRPAIVHFVGPHKPWHRSCQHPGAVRWRLMAAALGSPASTGPVVPRATTQRLAGPAHAALSVVLPWERGASATDGGVSVTVADSRLDVEVLVAVTTGEESPRCRARSVHRIAAGQDSGLGELWWAGLEAAVGDAVVFAPAGAEVGAELVATIRDAFSCHADAGAVLLGVDTAAPRRLGRLELFDLVSGDHGPRPAPEQVIFRRDALRRDDFEVDFFDGHLDMHLLLAIGDRTPVVGLGAAPPRRTSERPWPVRRYVRLPGSLAVADHHLRLGIGLRRLRSMLRGHPGAAAVDELTATWRAAGEAAAELIPMLGPSPHQRRARLGRLMSGAIGQSAVVAFADDDMWCPEAIGDVQVVPFPSAHGVFAGLPADDDAALDALRDATAEGLDHLGFPASSRWWLTHYPALASELRRNWTPVVDEPALVVFTHRPPTDHGRDPA